MVTWIIFCNYRQLASQQKGSYVFSILNIVENGQLLYNKLCIIIWSPYDSNYVVTTYVAIRQIKHILQHMPAIILMCYSQVTSQLPIASMNLSGLCPFCPKANGHEKKEQVLQHCRQHHFHNFKVHYNNIIAYIIQSYA